MLDKQKELRASVLTLHKYFLWATQMRDHFYALMPDFSADPNLDRFSEAGVKIDLYMGGCLTYPSRHPRVPHPFAPLVFAKDSLLLCKRKSEVSCGKDGEVSPWKSQGRFPLSHSCCRGLDGINA
jgi:hypothetical protein